MNHERSKVSLKQIHHRALKDISEALEHMTKTTPKDISEDQWVAKKLCNYAKTLYHLIISDLDTLFKQQSKLNKTILQG